MDENNDKFIIGDNTDGYRRSTADYDLDLFAEPKRKPSEESPQSDSSHRKTDRPAKKTSAKKPNFFNKKPSQPVPEKKGPSVKRHAQPPKETDELRRPHAKKRPAPKPEGQALSQNERRRLHAEQRRAQRRRKQIIQYVVSGVAVVAIMVVLSLTVFFKIDEITIEGQSPYTDEQIIAASGISLDENIIMCDADGVSDKLAKALPHIGSAEVKRSLSGKVTISVKVTPGRYSFIVGETAVIVDAQGKVLEQAPMEAAVQYTVVQGVEVNASKPGELVELKDKGAFDLLKNLDNQLTNAGIGSITSINLTSVYDISVVYEGRLTLLIGDTGSLDRKLALAAKVIERENELDPMQYGSIDLDSVEGKAFFRPLEEPTEDPSEEVREESSQPDENVTEGDIPPEEETSQAE